MLEVIPQNRDMTDEEFLCSEIQNTQERRNECWEWLDIDLDVFWQKYVCVEEEIAYSRLIKLQKLYDELFREEVEDEI